MKKVKITLQRIYPRLTEASGYPKYQLMKLTNAVAVTHPRTTTGWGAGDVIQFLDVEGLNEVKNYEVTILA